MHFPNFLFNSHIQTTEKMNRLNHSSSSGLLLVILTLCLLDPSLYCYSEWPRQKRKVIGESPFTPKAALTRYWRLKVSNNLPLPSFLLEKGSPMNAVQLATFSKLANDRDALSAQLPTFCESGNLFCFPDLAQASSSLLKQDEGNVNFASYQNKNFTNYGTKELGSVKSFTSYGDQVTLPQNSFRRYSHGSKEHGEKFTSYATKGVVIDQGFNTYGANAQKGAGDFKEYNQGAYIANARFTSYSDRAKGRKQSFETYTADSNEGNGKFTSYGKNGNEADNKFSNYGQHANKLGSIFSNYAETANLAKDTFTSYASNSNMPRNNFNAYGDGGDKPVETFKNYREGSEAGDDTFQTYGKNSNNPEVNFVNYNQSFRHGNDDFNSYGEKAKAPKVGFKIYGFHFDNIFKRYAENGSTSFAMYSNISQSSVNSNTERSKQWVEPGKFFREEMLKKGVVMPMPDIRDKMPKRSFLPRAITTKMPFSTAEIGQLKKVFHAEGNSTMTSILTDTLNECERAPSSGEKKRCVSSGEDMIDFATSVLGRDVAVRTTENTKGSNSNIMIGSVKGINGGEITESVSCHQSLFPYLLYYCHSVPKVRVYEANILDPQSKVKINHGVAICHLDTSAWSSSHGAFVALGSGPGKIEVCHWIFQNDMTWTIADHI